MSQTAAPDLSRLPFFASLPLETLEFLETRLFLRKYPADEQLFQPGARDSFFAIVERGLICLEGPDGHLQTLGPGDSFGEAMLRYGVPSTFSAHTLAPTTLWTLNHTDWLKLRQLPAGENSENLILQAIASPVASPPPAAPPATPAKAPSPRHFVNVWLILLVTLAMTLYVAGPKLATAGGSWLALQAIDAHRPAEAALVLRLALAAQPKSATLHDTHGYLLFRLGVLDAAQAEFEKSLRLDPELASAQNNLGVTLLAAGRAEHALDYLESASALDPGDPGILANLGDALYKLGDQEGAMSAYQRAFSLDPMQMAARSRWAELALRRGQLEAARQAWLEVIQASPQDAEAQLGLGVIAWREGRPAAAAQHLQSARQVDPGNPLARLYLGLALEATGESEKAALEFEQALALSQDLSLQTLAREHLIHLYRALYPPDAPQSAGMEGGGQETAP